MASRRPLTKSAQKGPGLLLWWSRDELVRARSWAVAGVAGLAAMTAVWIGAAFGGGADAAVGGGLLAAGTAAPLALTALRARRLHRLVKQVDAHDTADAEVEAETLAGLGASMSELGALVGSLPAGPIRDAGADALRAAAEATGARQHLVRRRHQLRHVRAVTQARIARRRLDDALRRCEDDIRHLDLVGDDLNASIAELVDTAADDLVEHDLLRVKESTERMTALADGLQQVQTRSVAAATTR
jgi:hypothetical protein